MTYDIERIERMTADEFAALSVMERRMIVARLKLQKYTNGEIAERVGVSVRTVDRDIRAVLDIWTKAALFNINEFVGEALAEREQLQREYLRAWRLSKQGKPITQEVLSEIADGEAVPEEVIIGYEELPGNIAFLDGASRELDKKIELIMGKTVKIGFYNMGAEEEAAGAIGEAPKRSPVSFYLPEKGSMEKENERRDIIDLPAKTNGARG